MILSIYKKPKKDSWGRNINKDHATYQCDHCGFVFDRPYKKRDNSRLNFCSSECLRASKKSGGKMREKTEKTTLDRFGVRVSSQNKEVIEKQKKTNQERHGGNSSMCNPEVVQKLREAFLDKFGVSNPRQLESVREKAKQTLLMKYGVDHQMRAEEVKEKFRETMIERFGVAHALQSDEIKAKIDWGQIRVKAHETLKSRGYFKEAGSKLENEFYEYLCEQTDEEIERWAVVNGWSIDFCINESVYVQFDGDYWHGLDRPLEEIKKFSSPRDQGIYGTYLRDKRQNEWFRENELTFVRVLESKYRKNKVLSIQPILEHIHGNF